MVNLRSCLTGLAIAAAVLPLSACNPIDEKPCSSGSYPVKASDGGPGSTCVKSGEPLPAGYTTYEPGRTPTTATG